MKKRILNVSTISLLVAFVITLVALIFSYKVFGLITSGIDKSVIAFGYLSLLFFAILIFNNLYGNKKPAIMSLYFVPIGFMLIYNLCKVVGPCISSIAIYFTVNMGDIETYRVITVTCFTDVGLYLAATIITCFSAFFIGPSVEVKLPARKGKITKEDEAKVL